MDKSLHIVMLKSFPTCAFVFGVPTLTSHEQIFYLVVKAILTMSSLVSFSIVSGMTMVLVMVSGM